MSESEKLLSSKVTIKINNKKYTVDKNLTIIQVADHFGIYIPRFCYHKNLSLSANCRMCLVDVSSSKKGLPACITPVVDGMEVFTQSPKTISLQNKIMEFLLINHPLDCPICDQGGECELQDFSMTYGSGVSNYKETKRVFSNPNIGPLIETNMTRCIQCTRCVRFGEEISGEKELGTMGRSDHSEITTYISRTVDSELSGNMIDLCPVGALTSKPFKFQFRSWELTEHETISCADSIGANIYVHAKNNRIKRIVPRENKLINDTWISDKDRFIYSGLYSKDRLKKPIMKKNNRWEEVSWDEAFSSIKNIFQRNINQYGKNSIAALASDSLTNEGLYLLQKFVRKFSNNIDVRLKQGDSAPGIHVGIGLDCNAKDIEKADKIFLFGSNLRKEMPLLNHRVHKAHKNGAKIFSFASESYNFNYSTKHFLVEDNKFFSQLFMVFNILKEISSKKNISQSLSSNKKNISKEEQISLELLRSKHPILILGFDAILNKDFILIYSLFANKKELNAKGGCLSFGSNARGALKVGAVPDFSPQKGIIKTNIKNILDFLNSNTKILFLVGIEFEKDVFLQKQRSNLIEDIENVISLTSFTSEKMFEYSSIILPISTSFEENGSFTNIFGQTQWFENTTKPFYSSKPLWKVFRMLGKILSLEGFDYEDTIQVFNEFNELSKIKKLTFDVNQYIRENSLKNYKDCDQDISIKRTISMYGTTSLLRRSEPLQMTKDNHFYNFIRISKTLINEKDLIGSTYLKVTINKKKEYKLPFFIDENLSKNTIVVPINLITFPVNEISNIELERT